MYLFKVISTSNHVFNSWKSFDILQKVITEISVSAVPMTNVFGALMNLALNKIRESTSSFEHFREVSATFFTFSTSALTEKHWVSQEAQIWKSWIMLAFASSFHEATKTLINACWDGLLRKAPRKSVGRFWTGPDARYYICCMIIQTLCSNITFIIFDWWCYYIIKYIINFFGRKRRTQFL